MRTYVRDGLDEFVDMWIATMILWHITVNLLAIDSNQTNKVTLRARPCTKDADLTPAKEVAGKLRAL